MKRYSNLDMTGNQITRVVIELVSTLPVTNLNIGRIVYLTTDDKFYGYTSSGWKEVTPDMFPGYAYLDPADDNTKQITKWSEPGTTPDAEDDGAKAVDEHSHKDDYVTAAQVATTLRNLRRFDDPSIDNTKNHYGYPVYNVNGQLTSIDTTKIVADYQWSDLLKNRMMIPRIAANGSVVESPFFVDTGCYKLTTRDQWETMIPTSGCVIENIKHMAEYILGVAYANLGNGIFATNSSGETIWISTTVGSTEEKLLSITSNGVQVQLNVTTTVDSNSTNNQVPTAKAVYDFIRHIFGIRYGFRIDKNNSDPDTRVEYLYDAVGMTPAKMTYDETTHKGTFNYGSWGNVWFIKNNRPVKLNFNGTVEAELNPNNYWETVDGQDSELETSTNCNFMSEIPIVYVKRWEDENYNYVVVCDKQYDKDYLAYANTDKDGNLKPLYAPMFKGYKDGNNVLRSIAGVDPLNNSTTSNEVMYSNNINTAGSVTGWQIEDIAKHELISDLLTLISKNTDSQTIFGNGVCQTSTRVFTGYNEIVTDTKTVKSDCGQFCGYNDNTHHVSIFHIQDFWGNRWDRCLGLITSGNKYYYKMTPENGGYTYTENIFDYTNNGYTIAQDYSSNDITPPANYGYIKNQSTGIFGNLLINTGASDSTYYCDYYWYNSSGVCLLILGGRYDGGRSCGARFFSVYNAPSFAGVDIGASPFYV